MNFISLLGVAFKSLKDRSVRSWITVFGIVVSVAVIFTLLTLSQGLNSAVEELFDEFGTDRIFITGGGIQQGLSQRALDEDIVREIERLPYFRGVIPLLVEPAVEISYSRRTAFTSIQAIPNTDTSFISEQYLFDTNMESGRFWRDNERRVVVVGYNVAFDTDAFFGRELSLLNTLVIEGERFRVIGIYERTGSPDDNDIFMPLEDARELFDRPTRVTFIDAVLAPGVEMDQARERLERLLERRLGENNFTVLTPEGLLRQFQNITLIITLLLGAIAAISLLVGAIGIANTMFTAVLEREKEIGIMKSVGAKNSDILGIFMIESGLIGLLGGIVGVILGIGVSLGIGQIVAALGFDLLSISINIGFIIFCLVFAFIVGILSGLLPSFIASRKKIIDTLRED
ncbi:MAG: ABC transporter permease [Candidatus Woesearchaeota archaeon]